MPDEFAFFFFQVKQVHGPCTSATRPCFLPNKQTIIKKNVRHAEKKNKMAVEQTREADGGHLSFWDAK